jgi:N-acetylglucosaminyldiphosphoundecaprenol N-acetyl-beta-D-mannosaminyltransferase
MKNHLSTNSTDPEGAMTSSGIPATRVLGIPVSAINMQLAVDTILGWVRDRTPHFVCVRDVHGIMRAQEDSDLLAIHQKAGLVTPDGMPLVWLARSRGYENVSRVCGADLVDALCEAGVAIGARHYFYGGKDGVAERMAHVLCARHPRLTVAGVGTPPFHKLSPEEDEAVVHRISNTKPDIVWVGLSTPKQEFWMHEHVGRVPGATLLGVGAAFDFFAGDVKRAPNWMRHRGLEWLHRLISDPRRLWRRYLVLAPKFVLLVSRRHLLSTAVKERR